MEGWRDGGREGGWDVKRGGHQHTCVRSHSSEDVQGIHRVLVEKGEGNMRRGRGRARVENRVITRQDAADREAGKRRSFKR